MVVMTEYSIIDEQVANGDQIRVLLVKTENPTVQASIDGDEHPLDWTGTSRSIVETVADCRARGEIINRVRVIGVRDDNHITEWDV
jgi:hypothetical protein